MALTTLPLHEAVELAEAILSLSPTIAAATPAEAVEVLPILANAVLDLHRQLEQAKQAAQVVARDNARLAARLREYRRALEAIV